MEHCSTHVERDAGDLEATFPARGRCRTGDRVRAPSEVDVAEPVSWFGSSGRVLLFEGFGEALPLEVADR